MIYLMTVSSSNYIGSNDGMVDE